MADHLPVPSADTTTWVQWALGGITAGGALVAAWLYSLIKDTARENSDAIAKLSGRVSGQPNSVTAAELRIADKYATKDDLRAMQHDIKEDNREYQQMMQRHFDSMLNALERRLVDTINNSSRRSLE